MAQPPAANGAPGASPPQPVFLSGSHHREACFGQEVVPAPAMVAELKQRRKIAEEKAAKKAKGLDVRSGAVPRPASGKRSAGKGSNVSVKELIDGGFLKAGQGTVTVNYKGTVYRASLLPTGQIEFNGQLFDAPSTFSVYAKRLLTPTKQGDDGWHSVHVDGTSLEEYRHRCLVQRAQEAAAAAAPAPGEAVKTENAAEGSGAVQTESGTAADGQPAESKEAAPASAPPLPSIYMRQLPPDELPPLPSSFDVPLPRAGDTEGVDGAEEEGGDDEPDTNNWVQCSRCQAWRVVPDEFWPDIDAANEEDWYCEEATWDLTQYEPFSKACKEFKT